MAIIGAPIVAFSDGSLVLVQDTQPETNANKIWFKTETAEIEIPTMEDINAMHDSLESLTGSIQYWGEPSSWGSDIARRISVEQDENLLTLNNTEATAETTSVKQRYYRLNDGIAFMQSSGLTDDSLKMQLKAGHTYRLLVRYLSGTVTSTSGTIDVYVRDENTTNTKGMSPAVVTLLDMADGYSDFVAGSSNINLMIYVSTGILCTNLRVAVYLIDLTKANDATYLDNTMDAVEEISDVVVANAKWINDKFIRTNGEIGAAVTSEPTGLPTAAGFQYTEMECVQGDIFEVNVVGGNSARAWCFVDSNRIKLDDAGEVGKSVYRGRIVAPEGAARLIVNNKSTTGTCVKVVGTGLVKEIARGDLLSRHSENLLTFGELTSGYINGAGAIGTDATRVVSDFIRVEPGMTYRLRMRVPKSAATNGVFHRCGTYDAERRFIALTANGVSDPDYEDATYYYIDYRYTFDSDVSYVRVVMRTYELTGIYSFEAESAPFMPDVDAGLRALTQGASAGTDMIATSNITSGKYFMAGYGLYLSTTAIAVGETIAPGTNCTQTNIAAALNAIAAQ